MFESSSQPLVEKTLQTLRKEQRAKLEEFKKQTKYYETRNLLEKFDETPPEASPRRTPGRAPNGTPAATPQRPVIQTPGRTPAQAAIPPHLAG
jgi:endoplasmic reticulum junction formation protein lunapark